MADEKQKSALMRRHEQLKRWEDSETNGTMSNLNSNDRRVKFQDGCVFLAACSSGDIEEVASLLKRGADINTANVDGLTSLHQACIDDNLDMCEFLIENGADIDVCDNEGWTPLHATASCAFCEIARFLLEYGANVAAVNNDGDLPIDIADGDDMEELLAVYMERQQIDADSARSEEENMMLADANQWLNSNSRVREKVHPKTGATALHVAAAKGYLKVMNIVLQAGVDIDAKDNDGWTPLHAAAHWGQEEACKLLVEHMCDIDAKNTGGQTCFDVADDDLLKLLEELKTKQATLRENKADIPIGNIIETKHPMKRRTSITRMSMNEKQHVVLGDVQEERQKMEAMIHGNIDEDKEEKKTSSASSSSEETSSDSETEKQNEINKQATAKANTQDNAKTTEEVTPSMIDEKQVEAQKNEQDKPAINGDVSQDIKGPLDKNVEKPLEQKNETEKTPDKTLEQENEKTDNPPLVNRNSQSNMSISHPTEEVTVNLTEVTSVPSEVKDNKPDVEEMKSDVKEVKTEENKEEKQEAKDNQSNVSNVEPQVETASERRRRRRQQLQDEAARLDKQYQEENKERGKRVLSKEEQKQTEPEKDTAEEEPPISTTSELPLKEPLHRTGSLPARLNSNKQAIRSRLESDSSPSSWRAGLRKTGSSSAVSDVPLRRIGEEQVQRSASSPRLALDNDIHDRPLRRSYISLASSIQEETTVGNRNTYPYTRNTTSAAAQQSAYIPLSRRREERQRAREKAENEAQNTSSAMPAYRSKSYELPKRDEETETHRKLRAKRARETRRSTQGVTKEDVAAAEETLKLADNTKGKEKTPSVTSTDSTDDSTYTRRRRTDYNKDDDTQIRSSFRRSRDYGSSTTSTDTADATSATTDTTSTATVARTSSYRRRNEPTEDVTQQSKTEDKAEEKKEDPSDNLDPQQRRLASIRERRRERRSAALSQNLNNNTKEEDEEADSTATDTKNENEDKRSSSRYSDRFGSAGDRSSYTDRYSTRTRDTDRPSSSYRCSYSRGQTTGAGDSTESTPEYKKLYEEQKAENERIKKELAAVQKELIDSKSETEKAKQSRLGGSSMDSREKRALERKISEMEEELKQLEILKADNQRLKEENGALIRVISKLSK